MPFKRFVPRRSGSGRNFSSRFRRGRLHKPGDRRWEKSQFFIGANALGPAGSLGQQLTFFHIASIGISLQQTGAGNVTGIALGSMTRKMLIGGIEFDWGLTNISDEVENESGRIGSQNFHQVGLASDDLSFEPSVPMIPAAVLANWNPFVNAFPVATLTSTTPTDDATDVQRPLHIHWKSTHEMEAGVATITVSEDLQVPQIGQRVLTPRGHVSKRLRLVFDDHQGLFFYHAIQNGGNYNADVGSRNFSTWFCGTLFWKYQF